MESKDKKKTENEKVKEGNKKEVTTMYYTAPEYQKSPPKGERKRKTRTENEKVEKDSKKMARRRSKETKK